MNEDEMMLRAGRRHKNQATGTAHGAVLDQQQGHWDRTLAGHPDMFGTEPSAAAIAAARLFLEQGKLKLLELGAGQGRDTLFFARQGLTVHGLDYTQEGIDAIQAKSEAEGLGTFVTASRHDAREPLPFADETFDACYSHMLLCMALTTPELERLVAEIRRTLRAGGLHVYTVRTTEDAHYGAGIDRGDDMSEVGGFIVHFFSRTLVDRLASGYELLSLSEFEEGDLPRRLWRVTMRRS